MAQITLQNVGITDSENLFRAVNLVLSEGDRIGVVGNNGVGKTTLLRCVAGLVPPTEGSVVRPKGRRIAFVADSIPETLTPRTLRDVIKDAMPAEERITYGWKADMLLDAFHAPESMRERPLSRLSGGWQRLALIARAWVTDPDFLLIDEPTNHLDLEKIMILERWLNDQILSTALMVVSHDRRFLDACTHRTLFLRPGGSRIYSYPFSAAQQLLMEETRALESQQDHEKREAERLRKSAHSLRQIGVNNYSAAALRKSNQIARRAEAIEASLPETHAELKRNIKLVGREAYAKRLISITNFELHRPDGIRLFQIGSLDIVRGDRVVILGRNGVGKTQLVRRIDASLSDPESARASGITVSPSVVMGYVDQNMSGFPEKETLRDYLCSLGGVDVQGATSLLVGSGFPITQHRRPISTLSPGERARMGLLALQICAPNFYLMDEPTNYLDIAGQEQLEAEIVTDKASGLLVSHDRTFVTNTGTRFLVIENEAVVEIASPDVFYRALAEETSISQMLPNVRPL